MPFQSEKQRRYMHANLPDIAKRWERDYAGGGIAELNQELNSLPEYYMPFPAAQGGRIGFDKGSPLIIWGKPVDEQWDNLNEDQKKYIRENFPDQVPKEAAQGGLIPAHEAGIYGLAEGGQLVKPGPGRQGYQGWDPGAGAPQATSAAPPGERGGPGPTFEEQAAIETVTPTGDGYTDRIIDVAERERREDLRNIVAQGEKTEAWEKSKEAPWNKPTITVGGIGVNLLTFALTGGIDNPLTRRAASKIVKWGADKIGLEKTIDTFVGENFGSIDDMKKRIEERVAKEDLIQSLPKGHPERIQLEGLTKETIIPEKDNGRIQETGITYDDMEDTNRKERASAEARQIQEKVDRSKQDAYYAAFRQKYLMGPTAMAAGGGRVPQGYNTGGLSNLFKLKNV